MADQYLAPMIDPMRRLSFDTSSILTSSTINALHFPGLSTSGMSESGGGASRRTSFLLDGIGMCESMTESFSSAVGHDDPILTINTNTSSLDMKLEKKDSLTQKRRRSRKSLYDASMDGTSLDKIETVFLIDEQNEADDAWLYEIPRNGHKNDPVTDNLFSWVHKEFKTNDINANKHRLLCKLDDMSHASTIRSVSCHNFAEHQRSESVKRSSTEQKVHSEPVKNGRLSSPIRPVTPLFNGNGNGNGNGIRSASPANLSPFISTNGGGNYTNRSTVSTAIVHAREVSKERGNEPMDYTDLEVKAKLQLEYLRQAERQGPLSKRFGGSNVSLASTSSATSVSITNRAGSKPPVAPKPTVKKNGLKPNAQTITTNGHEVPIVSDAKPSITLATRVSLLPPNSANNNRTRPPAARPTQTYRGSQTTYNNNNNNNPKIQITSSSSSVQQYGKNSIKLGSTFPSNENGLLNDVSNKPLTAPIRSQVGPQRRTILPQSSTHSSIEQIPPSSSSSIDATTIPRSASSSLSQGRKSGIPTIGKQQKPSNATLTRHHSLSSRRTTMNGF